MKYQTRSYEVEAVQWLGTTEDMPKWFYEAERAGVLCLTKPDPMAPGPMIVREQEYDLCILDQDRGYQIRVPLNQWLVWQETKRGQHAIQAVPDDLFKTAFEAARARTSATIGKYDRLLVVPYTDEVPGKVARKQERYGSELEVNPPPHCEVLVTVTGRRSEAPKQFERPRLVLPEHVKAAEDGVPH